MNRRTIGVLFVATWLIAVGWLARREFWRPRGDVLAEAALRLPPGGSFYTLLLGGQQIGYASSTIDTVAEGIRLQDVMVVEVPAMGTMHRTDLRTDALLSRLLRLRRFKATVQGDAGRFAATGQVSGDTLLRAEIESGDSKQQFKLPLTKPIILPALMPLRVALGGRLKVGRTYSLDIFDPMTLQDRAVDLTIAAESTLIVPDSADQDTVTGRWFPVRWDTVKVWKVEQRAGGLTLEAWIDDLGHIVRASTPLGFTMERTAYEVAYENFRLRDTAVALAAGPVGDLIQQTAIASNVRLPRGTVSQLRVRVKGVDLAGFDLDGGRQSLSGDTLTIQKEGADLVRARYRLGSGKMPGYEKYLAAEPLVQSDDPRIQAQARRIVGRVTDPRQAVELLNAWVYDKLEKKITVSVPSAVQVLENLSGDCNEHTVLFVALARSLGIPTRTAAGLMHANGRFYYHAWPEVYLHGWVAVDPTWGQFPADAAHLRFTIGGLARQIELLRLIGRVDLQVVDSRNQA